MISRCMNCMLYSRTVLMNSQACKQVKFWMISQATDLSQFCEKIANQANICQNYPKLSKVPVESDSKAPSWMCPGSPAASVPQNKLRLESWYEPSRQVFDWLHHVAPCCIHHFHAAVALAVRVLMQTANWSSQCLCPELEYTTYVTLGVFDAWIYDLFCWGVGTLL